MYFHAPSFDVFGSFFPVWTVCIGAAILLTLAIRFLVTRTRLDEVLGPRIVLYPSLVALFACAIWLFVFKY